MLAERQGPGKVACPFILYIFSVLRTSLDNDSALMDILFGDSKSQTRLLDVFRYIVRNVYCTLHLHPRS